MRWNFQARKVFDPFQFWYTTLSLFEAFPHSTLLSNEKNRMYNALPEAKADAMAFHNASDPRKRARPRTLNIRPANKARSQRHDLFSHALPLPLPSSGSQ